MDEIFTVIGILMTLVLSLIWYAVLFLGGIYLVGWFWINL